MRTLIFATVNITVGLIVALTQTAHAAKMPISISGKTADGHPCSIRAVVGEDKKLEHLVITSNKREIYSGNFMTVEKQEAVDHESTAYSPEQLKAFHFVPDIRNGELRGALMRADLINKDSAPAAEVDEDQKADTKRIRIKIYDGDAKGFSFSQRSVGTKYDGETFLFCKQ